MKTFFASTLALIGIITLILGLTRIYSRNELGDISSEAMVGGILVLSGMVVNVMGANIAKGESLDKIGNVTKALFIASFITAIVITIIGLINVFSPQKTLMSVVLILLGLFSAISSSSNAIAEDRKRRDE